MLKLSRRAARCRQKERPIDRRRSATCSARWAIGMKSFEITRRIDRDTRLTHDSSFEANRDNLLHWARIRAEVGRHVEIGRESRSPARACPQPLRKLGGRLPA
jgi:hypothetical protein